MRAAQSAKQPLSGRGEFSAAAGDALADLLASLIGGRQMPESVPVPVITPVLLMAQAQNGDGQRVFGPDATDEQMITVHEYQSIETRIPLLPARSYQITTSFTAAAKPGSAFGFCALIYDLAGNLCVTTETKLRHLHRKDRARLNGVALPRQIAASEIDWFETGVLSQAAVEQYLLLSGDDNPLHRDRDHARGFGLDDVIVPGMLVAGLAQYGLGQTLSQPAPPEMRIRFMAPVDVGSIVRFGVINRDQPGASGQCRRRVLALRADETLAFIADFMLSGRA